MIKFLVTFRFCLSSFDVPDIIGQCKWHMCFLHAYIFGFVFNKINIKGKAYEPLYKGHRTDWRNVYQSI